jgi:hypothetical protein
MASMPTPTTALRPWINSMLLQIGFAFAAVAAVYVLLLALLWWRQESLIFLPARLAAEHRFDFGADVHESWIPVEGARLNALHLRLPAPDGVVFYLHGNAGNLQGWFHDADLHRRANFDLFMLNYRGYGKSGGTVESEAQLHADVRAAWAAVAPRYAGKRRVILGRSLGAALAATLAAELQPDLTVLVSPYTSAAALAAEYYPWVPRVLLRYPLRTDAMLRRVKTPVLLIHGDLDDIIGPQHSERLLAQAPHGRLLRVQGAGHNDLQESDIYAAGIRAALDAVR